MELLNTYGIDIAYSTMHRYCVTFGMYNVVSYLKPHLSLKQMVRRINFVLALITSHNRHISTFGRYELTIDVDEKWFYVVPLKKKIRLYPGDEYPGDDTAQHKSHIPRIMFLAAVGKPHTLPDGTEFDGKIGIWPFVEDVEAQRSSKNRIQGTAELKGINVTAEDFFRMVIMRGGLLDAIKRKLRAVKHMEIKIRMDGATPHTGNGNLDKLRVAGSAGGWNIVFDVQPSNSPNLNKLDLCFFTACSKLLISSRERANH